MNRGVILILFCVAYFLAADSSYGAGMIYRVQQMKAQKQHGPQMTPEQYRQYQEYQEQQQGDHSQNEETPAQPTYQQTVEQRNQAIAQAILDAHKKSVTSESQPSSDASSTQENSVSGTIEPPSPASLGNSSDAKDVVDLAEVWKKLDKKSTVWPLLIDDQAKILTVSEYMARFRAQGVNIKEQPTHYVQMIDQIGEANPQLLQRPFGELLQMMAIIDYDFDNGIDKDLLARKVLGDAGYEANKKRFTQH